MSAGTTSAFVYTALASTAALGFFGLASVTGDHTWVARIGGAGWVFLLSMIILMPTITPWVRQRIDGR